MMSTHVVTRVALGPADGVPAAVRREIESEILALHRPHRGHDAVPVLLPGFRVGPAAMGVGDAVHFPAEGDDRVRKPLLHQVFRQPAEMVVEVPVRGVLQQIADVVVGHALFVALHHRHVEHEQPVLVLTAPVGPRPQEVRVALDARPPVTRQIGVADPDVRPPEPVLEVGHPPHPLLVGSQKRTQRRRGGRDRGGVASVVLLGGAIGQGHKAAGGEQADGHRPQSSARQPPASLGHSDSFGDARCSASGSL